MPQRNKPNLTRNPNRVHHANSVARAKIAKQRVPLSKRARGEQNLRLPFVPPEDWYESAERRTGYKIITKDPGRGYRHVLTPEQIRARLAELPASFVDSLEIVQLSRMTRKKQSFPCYGMQWGTSLYLYPIEEGLIEYYNAPPKPSQVNEARMYGGRWINPRPGAWQLVWTDDAITDFYLNNILIHELAHLLDNRNSRSVDRERYAEWFAVEYGYRRRARPSAGRIVRRHARAK